MPYTVPETKLPKPKGQKGHAFDLSLPQPMVRPQIMTCQIFWAHELCLISRVHADACLMQMLVTAASGLFVCGHSRESMTA